MIHDYLCRGCLCPIHWFCSEGNPCVYQSYGHGIHYFCATCHSKQLADFPHHKKVTGEQPSKASHNTDPSSELPSQTSEASHDANPPGRPPSCSV